MKLYICERYKICGSPNCQHKIPHTEIEMEMIHSNNIPCHKLPGCKAIHQPNKTKCIPFKEKTIDISGNIRSMKLLDFKCDVCLNRADYQIALTNDKLPNSYFKGGIRIKCFCEKHLPERFSNYWDKERNI